MDKYLITGGSGFIGTNLIDFLLKMNIEILNIDIQKPKKNEHLPYYKALDLLNVKKLNNVVSTFDPNYVIHLAARTDLNGKSISDYKVNSKGTKNLILALNNLDNLKKVVFTSSMLVCKVGYLPSDFNDYKATTIYGKSKVLMEESIKKGNVNFDWTIIRPTSIWGPWFETYKDFFLMVKNRTYFNIKNGKCLKTYGYVENAVFQIFQLLHSKKSSKKVFYIGDKPPMNIVKWSIEIAEVWGVKKPLSIPFFIIKIAALLGDILKSIKIPFPITSFRLMNMTTDNNLDLSNTFDICGNLPFSNKQGVEGTISWIKKQSKD